MIANLHKIQGVLKKETQIMAIVKSNGYGHGMIEIAQTLSSRVQCFGVGLLHEGCALRKAGIKNDILILGPTYDFERGMKYKLTLTIENIEQGKQLFHFVQTKLKGTPDKIKIHVKVNTGFSRFGFDENALQIFLESCRLHQQNIDIDGMYSHVSMTKKTCHKKVEQQNQCFLQMKTVAEAYIDVDKVCFHIANSEITMDYKNMHYDMVRIGNGLFSWVDCVHALPLEKIATLELPIVSIHKQNKGDYIGYGQRYRLKKKSVIGIVEAGFYEGIGVEKIPVGQSRYHQLRLFFRRMLKGVLRQENMVYQGKKVPMLGMVNMQYTMLDITGTGAVIGDKVVYQKSPLYIKENIERRHILEENDGTHY